MHFMTMLRTKMKAIRTFFDYLKSYCFCKLICGFDQQYRSGNFKQQTSLQLQSNQIEPMTSKRSRPQQFQINQKTLQYKKDEQINEEQDGCKKQGMATERKIYKIKRDISQQKSGVEVSKDQPILKTTQEVVFNVEDQAQSDEKEGEQNKPTSLNKQQSDSDNKDDNKKEPNLDEKTMGVQKIQPSGLGIFGQTANSINLFKNVSHSPSVKFGNQSMFGSFASTGNQFFSNLNQVNQDKKVQAKKQEQENQDEAQDEDSSKLQKQQEDRANPQNSKAKFQYGTISSQVFQEKAIKIKKESGQIIEGVDVIVQSDNEKGLSWITVRLSATKNQIITGFLVKGKSDVRKLGQKCNNVTVSIMTKNQKSQPILQVLKIQFEKEQKGQSFIETVKKMIH